MSISQKIRKTQIKTTAKYYLTPVKIAVIRNSANCNSWCISFTDDWKYKLLKDSAEDSVELVKQKNENEVRTPPSHHT